MIAGWGIWRMEMNFCFLCFSLLRKKSLNCSLLFSHETGLNFPKSGLVWLTGSSPGTNEDCQVLDIMGVKCVHTTTNVIASVDCQFDRIKNHVGNKFWLCLWAIILIMLTDMRKSILIWTRLFLGWRILDSVRMEFEQQHTLLFSNSRETSLSFCCLELSTGCFIP